MVPSASAIPSKRFGLRTAFVLMTLAGIAIAILARPYFFRPRVVALTPHGSDLEWLISIPRDYSSGKEKCRLVVRTAVYMYRENGELPGFGGERVLTEAPRENVIRLNLAKPYNNRRDIYEEQEIVEIVSITSSQPIHKRDEILYGNGRHKLIVTVRESESANKIRLTVSNADWNGWTTSPSEPRALAPNGRQEWHFLVVYSIAEEAVYMHDFLLSCDSHGAATGSQNPENRVE
jgi:hypothetical protein